MSNEEKQQQQENGAATAATAPAKDSLHKLNNAWSLWYLPEARAAPGSPPQNTNDLLRKADSFNTIEEFWSIYNALPAADKLSPGEQFMFFRDPIQPQWEDAALEKGETFAVWTDHVDAADKYIQTTLAGMLGESFTVDRFDKNPGILAGFRYSSRTRAKGRQWKLDLWTTDKTFHSEVDTMVRENCEACGIRNPLIFSDEFGKKKA